MFSNTELEQIEVTIEQAQDSIDRLAALTRLRRNADFKLLIEEGFLKDEAVRLVLLKAEPSMQDPAQQRLLENMSIAVGYFRQYLNKIYQFGAHAEQAIEAHRNTRSEIMAEAR